MASHDREVAVSAPALDMIAVPLGTALYGSPKSCHCYTISSSLYLCEGAKKPLLLYSALKLHNNNNNNNYVKEPGETRAVFTI